MTSPPSILDRLRDREGGAQREARAQYFPRVLSLSRHLLQDAALAEQTAEDVWMDFLFEHVARLRHEAALDGYLRMMTVRRCRRTRERLKLHEPLEEKVEPPVGSEHEVVAALDTRRLAGKLDGCIGKLNPRVRQVIRMRFQDGLNQQDIGERFGFSKQYAGRLLAKGLDSLRQCLEETA